MGDRCGERDVGKLHTFFNILSKMLLGLIVLTVGVVLFVVVGPILLNIDILAEPTYSTLEDLLKELLFYLIVWATGYVITSWVSHLSMPETDRLAGRV